MGYLIGLIGIIRLIIYPSRIEIEEDVIKNIVYLISLFLFVVAYICFRTVITVTEKVVFP